MNIQVINFYDFLGKDLFINTANVGQGRSLRKLNRIIFEVARCTPANALLSLSY